VELPEFLLDRWVEQKHFADPPIDFDLASSTGPVWTLRKLLALSGEDELPGLLDTCVLYTSAAGTPALRAAIAALHGVEPDEVQVVTRAAEALLILFFLAAEPGRMWCSQALVTLPTKRKALWDCDSLLSPARRESVPRRPR
jgi:hypothetical protein